MNTMTLIVLVVVIIAVVLAIIGTKKTMQDESCCGGDKNCSCCKTEHCSIKKNVIKPEEAPADKQN